MTLEEALKNLNSTNPAIVIHIKDANIVGRSANSWLLHGPQ